MTKVCRRCDTEKTVEDFFRNKARADGYQTYCKPCTLEYNRDRHRAPKVAAAHRRRLLVRKYGITQDDFDRILESQGGGCAICGAKTSNDGRSLHVDHDHKTGAIRSILCYSCNSAAGKLRDDPDLAMRLALYLERHAAHPSGMIVPDRGPM